MRACSLIMLSVTGSASFESFTIGEVLGHTVRVSIWV
jgi:hypothetical protein